MGIINTSLDQYMKLTQNQIRKNAIIASTSEIETKSNE
jgi:hypothetical protein